MSKLFPELQPRFPSALASISVDRRDTRRTQQNSRFFHGVVRSRTSNIFNPVAIPWILKCRVCSNPLDSVLI